MRCMVRIFKKTCAICKVQDVDMIKYENRSGIRMLFCNSCKKYAEKRSFKVIKHYPYKKVNDVQRHMNDSRVRTLSSN
jgi:hypothetical protein